MASNATLLSLLEKAYGLHKEQIAGPGWIRTRQYAISVAMPPGTTLEQFRLMLQNLLANRFAIRLHHEVRDIPVYTLILASGGPRMSKWSAADVQTPPPDVPSQTYTTLPPGLAVDSKGFPILPPDIKYGVALTNSPIWRARATCRGCNMAEFLRGLSQRFALHMWWDPGISSTYEVPLVVDRTGLIGRFSFNLEYNQLFLPPILGQADPDDAPPLFSALEKQLGLKLVKGRKAPMNVLVVDYAIEVPAEN